MQNENKNQNNNSVASRTQRIIAITTITTMAAAGMSYAQTATVTEVNKGLFEQAMSLFRSGKTTDAKQLLAQNGLKPIENEKRNMRGKGHGMHQNRKEIEDAIMAGDFAKFQLVSSDSPLKNITQETFNLLTPQFIAKKNAGEQIRNILTAAGVPTPTKNK